MASIRLSRRTLIASGTAGLAAGVFRPGLSRAADRPALTHGVQSGDVSGDSAVLWTRSDRPARARFELSTTESFRTIFHSVFADALPESDGTVKVALSGLPAGQDIFYRVRLQDVAEPTILGEPVVGRFRTPPADRRSVSFCWSGSPDPHRDSSYASTLPFRQGRAIAHGRAPPLSPAGRGEQARSTARVMGLRPLRKRRSPSPGRFATRPLPAGERGAARTAGANAVALPAGEPPRLSAAAARPNRR